MLSALSTARLGGARLWLAASVLAIVLSVSAACYHSIVTTGLEPGDEVHEKWKPAFIAGLVPASLDVEDTCGDKGMAMVETQHSFLNYVVGFVTLGIFTPMDIRVTCAAE